MGASEEVGEEATEETELAEFFAAREKVADRGEEVCDDRGL